jgi:hypothetical protein
MRYGTKMNSSNFGFIYYMSNFVHIMHEGQNSLFMSQLNTVGTKNELECHIRKYILT